MIRARKTTLLLLGLFFWSISLHAGIYPVKIEERVKNASQIVLAKAIAKKSYWAADKANIYTAFTMEIRACLKGSLINTVDIIIPGGEVEDMIEVHTPGIDMEIGLEYLLILEDAPLHTINPGLPNLQLRAVQFQPYAYMQGILPYTEGQYIDYLDQAPMDEQTALRLIHKITQFTPVTSTGMEYLPRTYEGETSRETDVHNQLVLKNEEGLQTPVFYAGLSDSAFDMEIEGFGFGNTPGSIQFPNANTGGTSLVSVTGGADLILWTDQHIKLKIPENAGSGTFYLRNATGGLIGASEIIIEWSVKPIYSSFRGFEKETRQDVHFLNRNEKGGYTIYLNGPTGLANTEAARAFERAMNSWKCASGVNWQLAEAGTTAEFGNDGLCVVQFQKDLPAGVLGITTSRYKATANSACQLENTLWYLHEFDIQLAAENLESNKSWNFSTATPTSQQFDFETVTLHELGHAHGLGHVIEASEVMYHSISPGMSKRTVTEAALEGSHFKMHLSSQENCISTFLPMQQDFHQCLPFDDPISTSAKVKVLLEGYYDSAKGLMNTNLLEQQLLPPTSPYELETGHKGNESNTFSPDIVDWLLLEIRAENDWNQVIRQKSVLLRKDGQLVNENGSELITFNDLEDGNYYIAIFHKSHLPIVSRQAISLSDNPALFDFTLEETTAMGDGQLKEIDGKCFMNSGDFDGNGIINNLDFNFWKQNSAAINTYSPADADGNGIINNQDFNLWKQNGSKVSILSK